MTAMKDSYLYAELYKKRPWIESYDPDTPIEPRLPNIPAGNILLNTATCFPDKKAFWFYGTEMTFWELYREVNKFAHGLVDLGIKQGDRVGLLLPNCPQFIIAFWGILTMGGVVVNMNPLYTPDELEFIVHNTEMTGLVTYDALISNIEEVTQRVTIDQVIVTRLDDYVPDKGQATAESLDIKKHGWQHMGTLLQVSSQVRPRPDIKQSDPAVIQFTGGTTGVPKGATLTHDNIVAGTYLCAYFGQTLMNPIQIERRKSFCVLPYSHVYGEICQMAWSIKMAATQILLPRFEINEVMDTLAMFDDITYFAAVPTMLNAIYNHPRAEEIDLGKRIVFVGSGAAPCPPELINRLLEMDVYYQEGCGMSETVAQNISQPPLGKKKVGSIGIPYPGVDIRLVDPETGEDVQHEPFQVGEIVTTGPLIMKGYWNNPEETANQLKDGWLYTGDLAYRDEEWHFFIVDRSKDMVISGGYNVFPSEVDGVIFAHPKVYDAICIGIPDEYRGESLKAFVHLKPGETCTAEEIIAFCREKLAPYKIPKEVEFRDSVPRTPTGKALRRILREEEMAKRQS